MPPNPPRQAKGAPSTGSETSSSGSSCSSGSLQRTRYQSVPRPPSSWGDTTNSHPDGDNMSLRSHAALEERLLYHQNLTRSRSFGGLVGTPRTRRSLPGGTLRPGGWAGQGILGQGGSSSPRDLRRMASLTPHVKMPKSPRPERASQVSTAVGRGIRDCITATRHDLLTLRQAQHDYKAAKSEGRVYEMEKQLKAAERYLKKLEFLLSQVEDLNEQYSLNQRLRDGVRTMAYAYALSPGKEKASALSNVRSGYKECTDTLCGLEVQIEQIIGTLSFEMKGIQGFARLCPGDVFEVAVKHGSQKWKAKGRITKENTQIWDNPSYIFKALIGEMLVIKAMEVRILGKTVLIGRKICETKELFSPHPQLMTVNLNPSGSLKLNVVITWNPLECSSDETLARTASFGTASPRSQKKSVLHGVTSSPPVFQRSNTYSKDEALLEGDRDSSFGSMSARSSTTEGSSPMSEYRNNSPSSEAGLSKRTDSHDSISVDCGRDCESPQCDTGNFTLVRKKETKVEQWARYSLYDAVSHHSSTEANPQPGLSPAQSLSQSTQQLQLLSFSEHDSIRWNESLGWDSSIPTSLPKVVNRLKSCLEDIQGQFPQLHHLEEVVLSLHGVSRKHRSRHDSNTSEISLSVESALECFDFLNAECDDDFRDDDPAECMLKNQKESLAREQAKEQKKSTQNVSELVSGCAEIDTFLLVHLKHSLQLLQDLGSFGPLRRKEKESLIKLENEGKLLEKVMAHKHNFDTLKPHHIIPIPHVQVLWDTVSLGDEWCVTGKAVVDCLLSIVSSLVESEDIGRKVLQEIVRTMTDSEVYSDCLNVTVGHFLDQLRKPLQENVPQTATSLTCLHLLQNQQDPLSIEKGLSCIKNVSIAHTKLISHLLASSEHSKLVQEFLQNNNEQNELLDSLLDKTLLQLESTNPTDRSSACLLLGSLLPILSERKGLSVSDKDSKDESNIDKKLEFQPIILLSFLQQNDPSEQVRSSARNILLEQGTIGLEALKHIQLSTHGFQGVQVKDN